MDGSEFRELLYCLHINTTELANRLRVCEKTIKRYTSDGYKVPFMAVCATMFLYGQIGHRRWQRWRFSDEGKIVDPWGKSYWPDEIVNVDTYRQALRATESLQINYKDFIDSRCYQDKQYRVNQGLIRDSDKRLECVADE